MVALSGRETLNEILERMSEAARLDPSQRDLLFWRVRNGRMTYGQDGFMDKNRDLIQEAEEELLDTLNYLAFMVKRALAFAEPLPNVLPVAQHVGAALRELLALGVDDS